MIKLAKHFKGKRVLLSKFRLDRLLQALTAWSGVSGWVKESEVRERTGIGCLPPELPDPHFVFSSCQRQVGNIYLEGRNSCP